MNTKLQQKPGRYRDCNKCDNKMEAKALDDNGMCRNCGKKYAYEVGIENGKIIGRREAEAEASLEYRRFRDKDQHFIMNEQIRGISVQLEQILQIAKGKVLDNETIEGILRTFNSR